jgi:hypothetical protein
VVNIFLEECNDLAPECLVPFYKEVGLTDRSELHGDKDDREENGNLQKGEKDVTDRKDSTKGFKPLGNKKGVVTVAKFLSSLKKNHNKRDLPNVAPVEYMDFLLNNRELQVPSFTGVAHKCEGVFETLNMITRMLLNKFINQGTPQYA